MKHIEVLLFDPAIYLEALRRLGTTADRVAFFDDAGPNVDGARARANGAARP